MSEPSTELDTIARELVALYRQAVRNGSADASSAAALSLGRALDAIERVRRSTHPENAYHLAIADIEAAREAMARMGALSP